MNRSSFRRTIFPGIAALALLLSACGDGGSEGSGDVSADNVDTEASGNVVIDGSSTVFPMADTAAELLTESAPDVDVAVSESGTGGGFEKFCADQTDISDASRPIEEDEIAACEQAGVEYVELQVATDALTMVVHPDLAVDCLTVDQIKALWGPDSKATNWNEIDPSFPDQEITLFGPGTDSGTYDYMANDVIESETEETRSDYQGSEDDNVIVQGVEGTEGATGYFGYSYYEENAEGLKALQIDGGNGCVEPSAETAQAGEYTPLARPLFIYVNKAKYAENAAVKAYVDFFVENLDAIAETAQFIPLSEDLKSETTTALEGLNG